MPRIPRAKEPSVKPLSGVPQVPVIDKSSKALAKASDEIFKISQAKGRAEIDSLTRTYATNAYSQDLIDADEYIQKLELEGSPDGAGYTEKVNAFLQQRMASRKESAPTSEAFDLYNQRFSQLGDRLLLNARDRESKLRTLQARRDQKANISNYSQRLLNNPNLDNAISFSRENETSIYAGAANGEYTPVEAMDMVDKMKVQLSESYLDGLESREEYSQALSFLRTSVPEKEFKEALEADGFETKTLQVSDSNAFDSLLSALPPGERGRRIKKALAGLKSVNKRNKLRDKTELNDVMASLKELGSIPQLVEQKNSLIERLENNTDVLAKEKTIIKDNVNAAQAYGDAKRAYNMLPVPLRTEAKLKELFRGEMAKHRSRQAKEMEGLIDKGHKKEDLAESAAIFTAPSFNEKHLLSLEQSLVSASKADTKELVDNGASYFYNNDMVMKTYADAVIAPGLNPEEQTAAFQRYSSEIDARYNHFGMRKNERKYLTPNMSRLFGGYIMQAQTADEAMSRLYGVTNTLGDKAPQAFDEMSKNDDLPEYMYALSNIDPRRRTMAERVFSIIRDDENVKSLRDAYDARGKDIVELRKDIRESFSDLGQALGNADPGGGNTRVLNGLKDLMEVSVLNDVINRGKEESESMKKWTKAFTEPYKVYKNNGSLVFTKWNTVKHGIAMDDFTKLFSKRANNIKWNGNSLEEQLLDKGIIDTPFVSDPIAQDAAQRLGDPDLARDALNLRLNRTYFVMGSSGESLLMMYDGSDMISRPMRTEDGKTVEIPIDRLSEFTKPLLLPSRGEFGEPLPTSTRPVENGSTTTTQKIGEELKKIGEGAIDTLLPSAEASVIRAESGKLVALENVPGSSRAQEMLDAKTLTDQRGRAGLNHGTEELADAQELGKQGFQGKYSIPNVNDQFLGRHEANSNVGYVPQGSSWSGLTLGMGVDLGWQNLSVFERWRDKGHGGVKLSKAEFELLKPIVKAFQGLKGNSARDRLVKWNKDSFALPSIPKELALKISYLAAKDKEREVAAVFGKKEFKSLSTQAKTALMSAGYQLGASGASKKTFFKFAAAGDWEKAVQYLESESSYVNRRNEEADLIRSSEEYALSKLSNKGVILNGP